ncbi:MAG TPA: hypothetical protein VKZ53_18255 [Candidatus Angelobacter sp.]|nr:hypothetical protein [Candidatus Angelobacter sp.]
MGPGKQAGIEAFGDSSISLQKTIVLWSAVSCGLWIVAQFLYAVLTLWMGRATGIGIVMPDFHTVASTMSTIKIFAPVFGIPIVVGALDGCAWYFLKNR